MSDNKIIEYKPIRCTIWIKDESIKVEYEEGLPPFKESGGKLYLVLEEKGN